MLDPAVIVVSTSMVVYFIYKRCEPSGVATSALLLVLLPCILALVLSNHFGSLLRAFVVTYLGYWSLLISFTLAYRVSPLHPLARYPGPVVCKLSKIWITYLAARHGKSYLYVQRLHERYGEVVRIGPNELSITHRDAVQSVLGAKGLPRGPYYETRNHEAGMSLDGIRDMSIHAQRRRTWTRGMNSSAMKYYEGIVRNTTDDLLAALRKREGESLDISAWMSFFGYDFMGHMCFSDDMGMLNNGGDSKGLIRLIQIAFIEASWLSYIPWTVPFAKFLGGSKTLKQVQDLGEAAVEHRIAKGSDNPDLFHHLLDEGENEAVRPSKITAMIDGQLATLAGSDTAAVALSHLWYFLHTHPGCYERLRQEIDEACPLKGDINSDLSMQSSMSYLNACIKESLRLYPPVITGLQREVRRRTGGRVIGPHFIPEGTQVSLWAYSMHRDPRYFAPLTDSFWPDRWLDQDEFTLPSGEIVSREQVTTEREVFMPFSHGPMVCAGKAVALAEMRAVACAIVREFDSEVADQATVEKWEDSLREAFITLRGPLLVTLKRREL